MFWKISVVHQKARGNWIVKPLTNPLKCFEKSIPDALVVRKKTLNFFTKFVETPKKLIQGRMNLKKVSNLKSLQTTIFVRMKWKKVRKTNMTEKNQSET